jgi:hypothetical protein
MMCCLVTGQTGQPIMSRNFQNCQPKIIFLFIGYFRYFQLFHNSNNDDGFSPLCEIKVQKAAAWILSE